MWQASYSSLLEAPLLAVWHQGANTGPAQAQLPTRIIQDHSTSLHNSVATGRVSAQDAHTWHRAALIHDSLWLVPLSKIERIAYFYLSTYCQKPWRISIVIMGKSLGIKTHRLKLAVDTLIERRMLTKIFVKSGTAFAYQVTLRTAQGWGQTALPIAPNGTTPLAPNGTTTSGQTALLTTALTVKGFTSADSALLSLFTDHFSKWTFNRRPMGRNFHFTRPMIAKALECMRHYRGQPGYSTTVAFTSFLDSCRDYLALPRDVLSESRDQRALSPSKWLNDWQEQTRLAGIYHDEKAQKVTRMPHGSTPP